MTGPRLALSTADAERQAELARLERARAEAEMRAAEEIRLTRMAEVERMELEGKRCLDEHCVLSSHAVAHHHHSLLRFCLYSAQG